MSSKLARSFTLFKLYFDVFGDPRIPPFATRVLVLIDGGVQLLIEIQPGWRAAEEAEEGEECAAEQDVHKHVVDVQMRDPLQVTSSHIEDRRGGRVGPCVAFEGLHAELYDREGAQCEEQSVDEEGLHERLASLHRMQCADAEGEPPLGVALDHADHQVKGEESVHARAEEQPDTVELHEEGVEEAVHRVLPEHVQHDVDGPEQRDNDREDAPEQAHAVDGAAVCVVVHSLGGVVADLEVLVVRHDDVLLLQDT